MKKLKLIVAIFMSVALFGGMSSVNAATGSITNTTTNHAITLSRTITGVSNKVTNTFGYTVTADSSNPTGVTGMPTTGSVAFSAVTPSSNTATATGTLELSGTTFTKNGDYVYTVQENSSTDATTYPVDTANKYTIKISVRNASATDFTSNKQVTILLYEGTGSTATKINTNQFDFTSSSVLRTITIKKTVTGNAAETDVYFPVSVKVTGNTGETYSITGQSYSGTGKITSLTSGTAGTIYIKHNETITINNVPQGKTYEFTETDRKGYTPTVNGTSGYSSGSKTVGTTNANTINNELNSPVPTGLILKYLPYVLIVAVAVAALVFVIIRSTKNNKKEIE